MKKLFDEYDENDPDPNNLYWHDGLPIRIPPREVRATSWTDSSAKSELDDQGYAPNWRSIATNRRQARDYTCEKCRVELRAKPQLLHVHHIDRDKTNNDSNNLYVLCALCHAACEDHEHILHGLYPADIAYLEDLRNARKGS